MRNTPRRSRLASIPVLCLTFLTLSPRAEAQPADSARGSDPRAVALAEATLEAMGGAEAWEHTRYLRFEFFGFRAHHWDRHTGRHRLEGQTRDGDRYVVLHSVISRKGRAWLNGEELAGEALDEWLERAYGAWVNDTYWLVMPYKLLDPGVTLHYAGEETLDGKAYDKVKLTFDSVGLTPGDTYWAHINRETGLMDRWAYFLQDWEEGREPTVWWWLDWDRYGDILLSPTRFNAADEQTASLGQLAVFEQLPDSVFESPATVTLD